jgi:hypothetical protein
MAEQEDKNEKAQKGAKPTLTPEQQAEAAAKKAARAEAPRACARCTTPRFAPS